MLRLKEIFSILILIKIKLGRTKEIFKELKLKKRLKFIIMDKCLNRYFISHMLKRKGNLLIDPKLYVVAK